MPLTKNDVEEGLQQLVDELADSSELLRFQVVGGAAVMLQANRATLTSDVDALFTSTPLIAEAIHRVASKNAWPEDWFNNAVLVFASHFDQDDDWELRFSHHNVEILIARPPLLLAMKLLAGRGRRDYPDIDLLVQACGLTTMNEAVAIFEHYYPTEVMRPRTLTYLEWLFNGQGAKESAPSPS